MKTLLFSTILITLFTVHLSATVLTVNTLDDTDDALCNAHCSLREAINTAAADDTIIFARELRGGTIHLTQPLHIQRRLTIDGPNKRRITLKGNNTFRILEARGVVSIDGLILRDGAAADGDGGGIYVRPGTAATLNLINIGIFNCTARRGGGIFMQNGTLILTDSALIGNTATGDEGGGGIDTFQTRVWITGSTISGNRATSAVDGAGGLRLINPDSWFIKGSTIVFNSTNGTSWRSAGGLVALNGTPGPLNNTILAKNTGINPDFYGQSGGGHNIVGISDRFPNGALGNIVGTPENPADPAVEFLAENGGGLPTHSLLPGSRAIDSGDNSSSTDRGGRPLVTDQRGYARIVNAMVDRGAYEYNSQPLITASTITGQVTSASGRGVSGAMVRLRNSRNETRFTVTNPFGFFRFTDVPADLVYTVECLDKRNTFPRQVIMIEELEEVVDF